MVDLFRFYLIPNTDGKRAAFYVQNEKGCRILVELAEQGQPYDFYGVGQPFRIHRIGYKVKLTHVDQDVPDDQAADLIRAYSTYVKGEQEQEEEKKEEPKSNAPPQ